MRACRESFLWSFPARVLPFGGRRPLRLGFGRALGEQQAGVAHRPERRIVDAKVGSSILLTRPLFFRSSPGPLGILLRLPSLPAGRGVFPQRLGPSRLLSGLNAVLPKLFDGPILTI